MVGGGGGGGWGGILAFLTVGGFESEVEVKLK